ncbi:MAG: hypothetical protein ABJP48_11925 [Erythrobacter sp.]
MLFAIIFLIAFVAVGGFAIYLSRTIEHGEARFDSDSGNVIGGDQPGENNPAVPAKRLDNSDDQKRKHDA